MSRKLTCAKFRTLAFFAGLIPCIASAVDMPTGISPERVDTSNLGMTQDGSTSRAPSDWTVQVGAYIDKAKAEDRLDSIAQRLPSELANAARLVVPLASDESHTVYRARFTGLSEQVAIGLCASLSSRGESCFASASQESVPESDVKVPPAAQISPETVDFGIITADATDAIADATPVLQEIADLASPPPATARAEAPVQGGTDLRPRPPTVTGEIIAAAAVSVPALRASFDQTPSAPAKPVVLATNDKASVMDVSRVVSNNDLADMRGGFFTAAGANFDFGATIQTMVNGQLALQTNLNWTPTGPSIQSLTGLGQTIQAQVQSQVQASLASAGIGTSNGTAAPANVSNTSVTNTPVTNTPVTNTVVANTPVVSAANTPAASTPAATPTVANLTTPITNLAGNTATGALNTASSALKTASTTPSTVPAAASAPQTVITIPSVLSSVTIPGATGGTTQILANINANQIQNIILNSASNQTISQNTNISLTIYNFQAWQQQLAQNALAAQLAHEVLAASGVGH